MMAVLGVLLIVLGFSMVEHRRATLGYLVAFLGMAALTWPHWL